MGKLKDTILGSDDIRTEKVHVKEWGCDVYVKGLSGVQRDDFENSIEIAKAKGLHDTIDPRGLRVKCLIFCLYDKEGNPIFTEKDAPELGEKASAVLDMLFNKAQSLSQLSDKDLEDMVKN